MIFSVVVIALIILAMVVFVIVLNDAERRIPVQYSKKMVGRKMVGGQAFQTIPTEDKYPQALCR